MAISEATMESARIGEAPSREALLDRVLGCLKVSEGEEIPELKEDLREAQLALIELRDRIIDDIRSAAAQAGTAAGSGGMRSELDRVNMSLSLLTGVEYPIQAVERDKIAQAEKVLRGIRTDL